MAGQVVGVSGPALFHVAWRCRKCGATGVARTTAPIVGPETPEHVMRGLFGALRLKLVKIHMRAGKCIPVPDDFDVRRVEQRQQDKPIVGLV
jgi:hypothetical protein